MFKKLFKKITCEEQEKQKELEEKINAEIRRTLRFYDVKMKEFNVKDYKNRWLFSDKLSFERMNVNGIIEDLTINILDDLQFINYEIIDKTTVKIKFKLYGYDRFVFHYYKIDWQNQSAVDVTEFYEK